MQEARTSLDDAIKKLTVDLHEHADRRSKEIEKAALQAGKEAADSLRARFETMQIEITNTRYDMLIRDAEKWRQQGVHVNELREYMRALSLAVQLTESVGAYEWLIEKALEGMQGALEAGARLGVGDVTKMTELIDALPSKYSIQADRLRGLVSPSTG
jgi:phage tail tape-measure protein